MSRNNITWFILRREPYYHKVQYSKVPKSDPAAALFGVIIGAFIAYLTLNTFGSGSSDLTDLMVVLWYSTLLYWSWKMYVSLSRKGVRLGRVTPFLLITLCVELICGLLVSWELTFWKSNS